MPRWIRPSKESFAGSGLTRVTCAAREADCFCRKSIAEEFSERLQRRVEGLKVGDPLDKNTDIGAINSAEQLEKIEELLARWP